MTETAIPGAATLERTSEKEENTYGQILKSSVLVGGSAAMNIAVGIFRAKAMALLLGPSGVGLAGLYGSIVDLASNVAGMGVNSSGVRQIADAASSGNLERVALTSAVLRRTSILLGLVGAALLIAFSGQVSSLTFGSRQHWFAICVLSLAVLFRLVSAGQTALIQGMRRISDLARMGVWGGLFGSIVSILLVYLFRAQGIVPSLVVAAGVAIITSWWYSRKIVIPPASRGVGRMSSEAGALLKLGFAFMGSSLMTMGAAYFVRLIVMRKAGVEATGLYQSAWTLGGMYVAFILQAMGADFYPRLCANAHDDDTCNRLVNEQTRIGLLLAGPGVLATLTLAPAVLAVFYSAKFHGASEILRWICLGTMLQVISWPMGFIVIAKGRQNVFLLSDLAWTVVYLVSTYVLVRSFGVNGAGIAFFGSYVFHALLTYLIVWKLSGFRWSVNNLRSGMLLVVLIGAVFSSFYVLPPYWAVGIGIAVAISNGIYSVRSVLRSIALDRLPRPAKLLLLWCGLTSSMSKV